MSDAAIELAEAIAKFVRRDIHVTLPSERRLLDGGRQTARAALVRLLDKHAVVRFEVPVIDEPNAESAESRAAWGGPPRAEEKPALPEADDDEAWTALMRKVYPNDRRSASLLRQLDAAFGTIAILRDDLGRANMVNRLHEQRERVDAKVMQQLKDQNDGLRRSSDLLADEHRRVKDENDRLRSELDRRDCARAASG